MKTAISIEDSLRQQADEAAHDLGLSRSGSIADAFRDYLRQRARSRITAQLNEACADEPTHEESRSVRKFKKKLPVAGLVKEIRQGDVCR